LATISSMAAWFGLIVIENLSHSCRINFVFDPCPCGVDR